MTFRIAPVVDLTARQVVAQQSTDDTGRTIMAIVVGLLVVAFLLAVLTIWYWRHTDPRKRIRPVAVQPEPQASVPVAATAGVPAEARSTAQLLEEDDADEWLRLTGPQALQDR